MTARRRLVVVGNGMMAATFLEELATHGREPFSVTVFGDEPGPAYDRIKLSTLLAGQCEEPDVALLDRPWYRRHGIELRDGSEVVAIDRARGVVQDARGEHTAFDLLVLATGSDPLLPLIEGAERRGVHSFRTLHDVRAIVEDAERARRAVVIGGGLLGLEAAYGLRRRGLDVSVVHLVEHLMERQLDPAGAALLRSQLEELDIEVHLAARTEALLGNGHVEGVRLADGRVLETDLVVVACGIRPRTELARQADLAINRGIAVDDTLQTSDPRIFAIGECCEHRGVVHGILAPLREQARVLARNLCTGTSTAYTSTAPATTLKVAGVNVFSAGETTPEDEDDSLLLEDRGIGVYKRVLLRDGRVRGAVFVGDLSTAALVTAALADGRALNGDRVSLVAAPPVGGLSSAAESLADDAVVCGCNGVSKATILDAIRARGCATRSQVTACTRASGSCGSCGPMVDALLAACGSMPPAAEAAAPSFCSCVPVSRPELQRRVAERDLRSVQEVLDALGNGVGCARCKPALAYLLDVVWCGDYREDRSARFINDRVHANIQKDGTFSVVPRMLGGLTTPAELRRIADVAERFAVPMVKVTGGQRLDLLGVRKQDLPAIWEALGMPSGHAYAKAVRTVKTCVGSEMCRFGVGDSTSLGVAMEQMISGLYTPHKVKSGVTGCPRNCAEVTVKDIGVMAITGGWEVYVGGAAGMTVRKADLLCTVCTAGEALRAVALFLQHYREEADYLERTYRYVERVGIVSVRRATVEAPVEEQEALLERFRRSKAMARDPWSTEAAAPRTAHQFLPLAPARGPVPGVPSLRAVLPVRAK